MLSLVSYVFLGAIHLTQMPTATIKSTQNIVTTTTRTSKLIFVIYESK